MTNSRNLAARFAEYETNLLKRLVDAEAELDEPEREYPLLPDDLPTERVKWRPAAVWGLVRELAP
jgi:hypothetical protein